jgi:hypothetical protein
LFSAALLRFGVVSLCFTLVCCCSLLLRLGGFAFELCCSSPELLSSPAVGLGLGGLFGHGVGIWYGVL